MLAHSFTEMDGTASPNTMYEFVCPACGYSALVFGRAGASEKGTVITFVCKTCCELFNVLVAQGAALKSLEARCPKGEHHPVAEWTFPGACAKCCALMEYGRSLALVD